MSQAPCLQAKPHRAISQRIRLGTWALDKALVAIFAVLCAPGFAGQSAGELDPKDRLVVETVRRLEKYDLEAAPEKVRSAMERYLAATRGSEEYFATVERFRILNEAPFLMEFAACDGEAGIRTRAAGLALSLMGPEAFLEGWRELEKDAARALLSVLPASTAEAVAVHGSVLESPQGELDARRQSLGRLGETGAGQERILAAVTEGKLDPALRLAAAEILLRSPHAAIAAEAAKHLELPLGPGAEPLPPIAELVRDRGDPERGAEVFARLCSSCHKVGDAGIDFGPALTAIGDKLAREALLEAILAPGAAISFGFEGVTVTLKDGRQSLGFVASETDSKLTLRLPGGLSETFPVSEIAAREALPVSLMPVNLQAAMSRQELADLVEYLASLRVEGRGS